jgi:hypothetical protein
MNINDQCDEKIFILISSKTVLLVNFDTQTNSSPSIIYQTKLNTTIENGLFDKRTNTIILLINQSNETYFILTLNIHDNLNKNWIEKTNKLFYSSSIHIALGQRYLYLLNNQTMLLQIFNLPLTSMVYKQNYLLNLPKNQRILTYLIDEKFQFLWILFEHYQYQLYICQLKTFACQLYMNIFNLNKPIQFRINWNYQQLYFYSKNYLIIFKYNYNQTDYSIHYLNSTQIRFLTICERFNFIEYISINNRQVCYQTCQDLGNNTNRIHTIQRISSLSNMFYCSKQRRIGQIVLMILILIEIGLIFGAILWLGYKYFSQSKLDKSVNCGIIWTSEKEFITHF